MFIHVSNSSQNYIDLPCDFVDAYICSIIPNGYIQTSIDAQTRFMVTILRTKLTGDHN